MSIKTLTITMTVICALFLLLDLIIHRHGHHSWENWPAFYGFFALVSGAVLTVLAKVFLKPITSRDENYYQEEDR